MEQPGMDTPILNLNPHYTNERFRHAQTVWGHKEEGLCYNYSDRLSQWDYAASDAAREKVKASGLDGRTPRALQLYLSEYHWQAMRVGPHHGWLEFGDRLSLSGVWLQD
jgi:hypothetical protein